jgi:hypothetical protein
VSKTAHPARLVQIAPHGVRKTSIRAEVRTTRMWTEIPRTTSGTPTDREDLGGLGVLGALEDPAAPVGLVVRADLEVCKEFLPASDG